MNLYVYNRYIPPTVSLHRLPNLFNRDPLKEAVTNNQTRDNRLIHAGVEHKSGADCLVLLPNVPRAFFPSVSSLPFKGLYNPCRLSTGRQQGRSRETSDERS